MVESIGGYILEQSVSVRAAPELIVADGGGGSRIFRQSLIPILHTRDTDLRYHISRLNKNQQHISCLRMFAGPANSAVGSDQLRGINLCFRNDEYH